MYLSIFFVEQSRGWSSLEPPLPTRFGIKEMHKRTVEYLLKLDAIKIAAKRLEIVEQEQSISKEWADCYRRIKRNRKKYRRDNSKSTIKPCRNLAAGDSSCDYDAGGRNMDFFR